MMDIKLQNRFLQKFGISNTASEVVLDSLSLISDIRNDGVKAYRNFSGYFNADPREFVSSLWSKISNNMMTVNYNSC